MKHLSLIPILLGTVVLSAFPLPATAEQTLIDSLLMVYDTEIAQADIYLAQRQAMIDELCQSPTVNTPQGLMQIGDLYRPYQCDSALLYYTRALGSGEPFDTEARIKLVYLLASIGYYNEGFDISQSLHDIPDSLVIPYYEAQNRLYGESAVYGKMEGYRERGFRISGLYHDSLYNAMKTSGVVTANMLKMELIHARNTHHYERAIQKSDSAFALISEGSHEYAIIAYETAIIYRELGQEDMFRQWLVRSAICDVRCGITDNGSSWMLAQMLFEEGQIERAYHYIEYSLKNAGFFNARLRYVQVNPLGNLINQAYQQQQEKLSKRLTAAIIAILCILALLVFVFIYTIRQNHRLHTLNEKQALLNGELQTANTKKEALNKQLSITNLSLQEANTVKEQYITRYLEVYSEYIRRLHKMARKAGEKDPDAFLSKEMADFYRNFDHTFLSIYRSFVTDFNALLKPDEQIIPKQGELLTTELRIFALIRLGIDSSAKIAELLCYSPNTIYNYRARVKNSALGEREDFENKVRQIGLVK